MKIAITADLHGHLPDVPRCDLLLIAGDILPEREQEEWVLNSFRSWIKDSPARRVVFIAGNHDFYFQSDVWRSWGPEYFREIGATYLEDSGVSIGNLCVWGTPWLEEPSRWAFSGGKEHLQKIPKNIDVLLSHSPPRGILDSVGRESTGSGALSASLQRSKAHLAVFGHIHEHGGGKKRAGEILFCNGAYLDEQFRPRVKPFLLQDK